MRRDAAHRRWTATVPVQFRDAPSYTMPPPVVRWCRELLAAAIDSPTGLVGCAPSLLLTGGTGTGKTAASWWVIGHLAYQGAITDWEVIEMPDLYGKLRPRPGVDAEQVLGRYVRAPLLVLDDVAAFGPTAWTAEIDYRLINARYTRRLPTVITTNHPVRASDETRRLGMVTLADRMEDRVLSRLNAMTGPHKVNLGLGDRRRGETPT